MFGKVLVTCGLGTIFNEGTSDSGYKVKIEVHVTREGLDKPSFAEKDIMIEKLVWEYIEFPLEIPRNSRICVVWTIRGSI